MLTRQDAESRADELLRQPFAKQAAQASATASRASKVRVVTLTFVGLVVGSFAGDRFLVEAPVILALAGGLFGLVFGLLVARSPS